MKVCILDCDDAKAWSPICFGDMFREFVVYPEDECVQINIANGNAFPTNLNEFGAIVITGSHYNCRDGYKLAWFEPLCDVVRLAASTGHPKIYGGCFGCQLIAHALGGQVDYNPNKVFFLKAESVQVNLDLIHKYFRNANENDVQANFNVIESHGDCVAVLPPDADRIGTSSSCTNEIFVTGAHRNILACQGHPEFDLQYSVYERIWPEAVDRMHRLNEDEAREYKKTFECYTGEDALRLRRLIATFLHP
jgi:GMP synthase (glutamine-hydrolysing)